MFTQYHIETRYGEIDYRDPVGHCADRPTFAIVGARQTARVGRTCDRQCTGSNAFVRPLSHSPLLARAMRAMKEKAIAVVTGCATKRGTRDAGLGSARDRVSIKNQY
jgi:hypothetical protein